ncbi:cupin domain-containing protein [Pelagibius sp.]|uniref:cupin domain-containing protein n=1 Tax=Pelagibius sp. TaxID=1931238 RepID=UPI002602E235|nr:cupin domain-containing protein [Pelagibius sp.]
MAETPAVKPLLTAAEIAALPELHIRHPFNPQSDVYLKRLAPLAGLARLSLTLARVPPGKESFVYHSHERDEEFLYILSGRGRAEIGEEVFEVGPGDFMGFPAPGGPPHNLSNPYGEDLVYLMAGEHSGLDIGHFPRLGKHIVYGPGGIRSYDDESAPELSFADFLAGDQDGGDKP